METVTETATKTATETATLCRKPGVSDSGWRLTGNNVFIVSVIV